MVSGQGVDSVTFHHFRPSLSSILAIVSHETLEPVGIRARCRFSDLSSLPSLSSILAIVSHGTLEPVGIRARC